MNFQIQTLDGAGFLQDPGDQKDGIHCLFTWALVCVELKQLGARRLPNACAQDHDAHVLVLQVLLVLLFLQGF